MSVSMCDNLTEEHGNVSDGLVDHCKELSLDIGSLLQNEDFSDVTFVVQNKRFCAHRVILASRSHYFRALLFGGMRESKPEAVITLKDSSAEGFQHLLQYVYTGKLKLLEMGEELIFQMLSLSNKYGFAALETAISNYLHSSLNIKNACVIYGVSLLYSLKDLQEAAAEFVDRNAAEVLRSEAFLSLSIDAVRSIIGRDSFCAVEKSIFKAVQDWLATNSSDENDETFKEKQKSLLDTIRLPLLSLQELLQVVRPTGLISPDSLLDAINSQDQKNTEFNYRGVLCPEENVSTLKHGAQVVQGEMCEALLDEDNNNYDLERGYTRHSMDNPRSKNNLGIIIKLGQPYIINHFRMLLWDRDARSYSYYIEVSMDRNEWIRVVDHSNYLCRSWQTLYFTKRVARYIRIVGTHNSVNKVFHVVSFEAKYTRSPYALEDGLVVPRHNVASTACGAIVIEGVSRDRNALLNGDNLHYDWDSGYTCHQLGYGAIIVQLSQPFMLSSMRMLLWDIDDRCYGYYIEVSTNQEDWEKVVDNSNQQCRSWQNLTFAKRTVCFIKIVGTQNTANEVFHCVHFESPNTKLLLYAASSQNNSSRASLSGEDSETQKDGVDHEEHIHQAASFHEEEFEPLNANLRLMHLEDLNPPPVEDQSLE